MCQSTLLTDSVSDLRLKLQPPMDSQRLDRDKYNYKNQVFPKGHCE